MIRRGLLGLSGATLAEELGADLKQEGERFKHRERIAELVEPWFANNDYATICDLFDENAVCYGPYRSFREMVEQDDDCSLDNPMMSMIYQPGIGQYLASGSPLRFTANKNVPAMPAPVLGQHTE